MDVIKTKLDIHVRLLTNANNRGLIILMKGGDRIPLAEEMLSTVTPTVV
jgi:hypothetical protein